MVANFSNDGPQGSDVTSTRTSGLASSKVLTMALSVSVRSGLVITSTSFRVVAALALGSRLSPKAAKASHNAALMICAGSGCCGNGRVQIAQEDIVILVSLAQR